MKAFDIDQINRVTEKMSRTDSIQNHSIIIFPTNKIPNIQIIILYKNDFNVFQLEKVEKQCRDAGQYKRSILYRRAGFLFFKLAVVVHFLTKRPMLPGSALTCPIAELGPQRIMHQEKGRKSKRRVIGLTTKNNIKS